MMRFAKCVIVIGLLVSSPVFLTAAQADPVADAVVKTANELRKQIPMRSGASTLVGVVAAGRQLKYSYKLDQTIVLENWLQDQTALLRSNVCKNPGMSEMMSIGTSYAFMYFGADGKFIGEITVAYSHCKQ